MPVERWVPSPGHTVIHAADALAQINPPLTLPQHCRNTAPLLLSLDKARLFRSKLVESA